MNKEVELELKTIITEKQFNELLSHYPVFTFIKQHNYYYFTNNLNNYAFRVRTILDKKIFTLKEYDGKTTFEYEKEFVGDFFDDNEIRMILNKFDLKEPFHIFGDLVTARAMIISEYAELCFDINTYNGITDYEIEYEVKKEHDYINEFNQILAQANIEYKKSYASKYKRCLLTLKNKD